MLDKILNVDCSVFNKQLDAHLDGELDANASEAMLKHARECEECSKKLMFSARILDSMRSLDDGVALPLSARSAWRRAVRKQSAAHKRRTYARAFTGLAAALICLVGTTVLFRQTGLLGADAPPQIAAGTPTYTMSTQKRIAPAREPVAFASMNAQSRMVVQADGNTDDLDNAPAGIILPDDGAQREETDIHDLGVQISSGADTIDASADAMRVYSAERVIETDMFDQETQALEDLTEEYGGYFALSGVDLSGKTRVANYIIRVPAQDYQAFYTALDNVGKTITMSQMSDDVSKYYFDAQSRLDAERLIVYRLLDLIDTSDGDALISLNEQLNQAYDAIDDLEKILRAYESDVYYSEVALTLKEVTPLPVATPEPSLGERSKSGFTQSLKSIGKFFGDMVVSMSIIAPAAGVVIALALVVGFTVYIVKRKRGKRADYSTSTD